MPGGTLTVPPEATLDTELATTTTHIPAGTLLVDVQNHLLDYVMHPDGADFTGFPQAACGEDDPRMCFSPEHWADLVFQQSDTTMAVLSAIPVVGRGLTALDRGDGARQARSRPSCAVTGGC